MGSGIVAPTQDSNKGKLKMTAVQQAWKMPSEDRVGAEGSKKGVQGGQSGEDSKKYLAYWSV